EHSAHHHLGTWEVLAVGALGLGGCGYAPADAQHAVQTALAAGDRHDPHAVDRLGAVVAGNESHVVPEACEALALFVKDPRIADAMNRRQVTNLLRRHAGILAISGPFGQGALGAVPEARPPGPGAQDEDRLRPPRRPAGSPRRRIRAHVRARGARRPAD